MQRNTASSSEDMMDELAKLPHPRDLLKSVIAKHPGASEDEIKELFIAAVEANPDMRKAIIAA